MKLPDQNPDPERQPPLGPPPAAITLLLMATWCAEVWTSAQRGGKEWSGGQLYTSSRLGTTEPGSAVLGESAIGTEERAPQTSEKTIDVQ
jgi:hypothetical protein